MRVMVTGSNGLLARNLIKTLKLNEKYEKIYCINRKSGFLSNYAPDRVQEIHANLNNDGWVKSIFESAKPDIIFHFAAEQGRSPEAFLNNVSMTSHLLKYCAEGTYFVYASSSTVYGDLGKKELCTEKSPRNPTSLYGASKSAGEDILNSYQASDKIRSLILRYCALVGEGASHGALPDIIRKSQNPSDTLELLGNEPGSLKPYILVSDAVGATLHLANSDAEGIFNVCPDDEITIKEIANQVLQTLHIDKKLTWLGEEATPTGDNKLVCLDNSKLSNHGWLNKYRNSLEAIKQATKEISKCEF